MQGGLQMQHFQYIFKQIYSVTIGTIQYKSVKRILLLISYLRMIIYLKALLTCNVQRRKTC